MFHLGNISESMAELFHEQWLLHFVCFRKMKCIFSQNELVFHVQYSCYITSLHLPPINYLQTFFRSVQASQNWPSFHSKKYSDPLNYFSDFAVETYSRHSKVFAVRLSEVISSFCLTVGFWEVHSVKSQNLEITDCVLNEYFQNTCGADYMSWAGSVSWPRLGSPPVAIFRSCRVKRWPHQRKSIEWFYFRNPLFWYIFSVLCSFTVW